MATYTSKFSIGDTAYIVNSDILNLESITITDVRIRESITYPAGSPPVVISYRGRTTSSQKDFMESELYFLDEAKTALSILISERSSTISSMR